MLEYLYQALASERGIKLEVSDPERARQRLYAARREAMDTALDVLSVVQSPTDPSHLWIIKRSAAVGDQKRES